jgi:transcriptional regulator with XRE-family HTH domain
MEYIVKSRLKEYRDKKSAELGFDMTQKQLAQVVGLPQPTISLWESPRPIKRIDVEALGKLAEYFGVGLWDMLEVEIVEASPEKATHPDGELEQVA